jgi:hypothetical protein
MKKSFFLSLLLGSVLLVSLAGTALAQGKTVVIPKGTTVAKLGPTGFKLTTPEGFVFEIASFKKTGKAQGGPGAVGILGDCGIHSAKGKLIASGTGGVLKSGPASSAAGAGKALKDVPPADYIKIDDEVTWLPATIQFPTIRIFDRQALLKLSPQPDPPGKVR